MFLTAETKNYTCRALKQMQEELNTCGITEYFFVFFIIPKWVFHQFNTGPTASRAEVTQKTSRVVDLKNQA